MIMMTDLDLSPTQRTMLVQMTGLLASLSSMIQPNDINIANTSPSNTSHQYPATSDKNLSLLPWISMAFIRYSMPSFRLLVSTGLSSEVFISVILEMVELVVLTRPNVGTHRPRKG